MDCGQVSRMSGMAPFLQYLPELSCCTQGQFTVRDQCPIVKSNRACVNALPFGIRPYAIGWLQQGNQRTHRPTKRGPGAPVEAFIGGRHDIHR